MKYRVNEIFESVQAEGVYAGHAAVFVRFSGCNLACPFCDTKHQNGMKMSAREIEDEVLRLDPDRRKLVVFTGGEPLLQLRKGPPLCREWACTIETNGTLEPPAWYKGQVCGSPKSESATERLYFAHDIKCLMGTLSPAYLELLEREFWRQKQLFVQPLEEGGEYNIDACLQWLSAHPRWRLSVQWHKLLGVQ